MVDPINSKKNYHDQNPNGSLASAKLAIQEYNGLFDGQPRNRSE